MVATPNQIGAAPVDDHRDDCSSDEHPVGDGVEDLPELRDLVEAAGDEPVYPVGRPEHRQQDRRRRLVGRAPKRSQTNTPIPADRRR